MANHEKWEPQLGVLGTGRMGPRLAAMFARAGRKVVLGSRDPDKAAAIVDELGIPTLRAGRNADALAAAAVLPAVFLRDGLLDLLDCHCSRLRGKLLIDISNPFNADYSAFTTPWDTSSSELIQRRFPQARVVGAFKNVFWEVFDQPDFQGTLSDVLVTGDDPAAKSRLLELAEGTPFRYPDAGALENSRIVERLTFITGNLGRQLHSYPRMNWRLLTQPVPEDAVAA